MEKTFDYYNIPNHSESIYRYSPVFVSENNGDKVIIKKTKNDTTRMKNLFKWTRKLSDTIGVVTPVMYKNSLYHNIDEDNWVMYPFIEGRNYNGSLEDIYLAGSILGKIHKLSNSGDYIFMHGFNWNIYDEEFITEVKKDIDMIHSNYSDMFENEKAQCLFEELKNLIDTNFDNLKEKQLPYVDGVWDYKANNLIYTDNNAVLIDPDNGGFIPRIFDLALSLILFHTELEGIPSRIFTIEEWNTFMSGYQEHIALTDVERMLWKSYLELVFIDEAMWAINDLADDETPRQKLFIKSLLLFEPDKYKL